MKMNKENQKFKKQKRFTLLPRTDEVYKAKQQASKSEVLKYYHHKRLRNILIWSLILIEPFVNVITFVTLYYSTKSSNPKHFIAFVGIWTSIGVLASYLAAYIPIVLGNKIWVYTYKKSLIIVYIGILKCNLVIDEKLWDKKPKKVTTYLYGRTKDGQKIEVCKSGMTCQISMDVYQKPITPVI